MKSSAMRPLVWRIARSVGIGLGVSFLLGIAFVMIFEDRLIYFPTKEDLGRGPGEDVFLTTSDGVRIHGWYAAHPDARFSLLYFHGNAGHLGDRRGFIDALRSLPANVLAIDYRGYGRSEGTPNEEGLYRDAAAAYEWLTAKTPPERIVLLGESLGAGPACEIASTRKVAGLIVQSAFTNARDMSRLVMPIFPARWFMRTRYDNLVKLRGIGVPKLFVHARNDEIVPFSMAERLFEAAAPPKEKSWFDRGGHNGLIDANDREYFPALRRFLASLPG